VTVAAAPDAVEVVVFEAVVVVVPVEADPDLATPPWWEHAPLPVVVLVVPSVQVTVAGAACAINAAGSNTTAANAYASHFVSALWFMLPSG
jgi:hypothetical protein